MSSPTEIILSSMFTAQSTGAAYVIPASKMRFEISSQRLPVARGEVPTNPNLDFTPNTNTNESGESSPQKTPYPPAKSPVAPSCLDGSSATTHTISTNDLCRELVDHLQNELAARTHSLQRDLSMVGNANIAELRQGTAR